LSGIGEEFKSKSKGGRGQWAVTRSAESGKGRLGKKGLFETACREELVKNQEPGKNVGHLSSVLRKKELTRRKSKVQRKCFWGGGSKRKKRIWLGETKKKKKKKKKNKKKKKKRKKKSNELKKRKKNTEGRDALGT